MDFLSILLPVLVLGGNVAYGNVHSTKEAVVLHPSTVENLTAVQGSDVTVTFSIPNITDIAYIRVFTPNPRWRNHPLHLLSEGHPHNFTTACDWSHETLYCNLTVIDVQPGDEGEYRIENDICQDFPLANHCMPANVRKFKINLSSMPANLHTTQSTQTGNHTESPIGQADSPDIGAAAGIIGGTCGFLAALWFAAWISTKGSRDKKEVKYKSVEDMEMDAMLEKELEKEEEKKKKLKKKMMKTPPAEGNSIKVEENGRTSIWTTV